MAMTLIQRYDVTTSATLAYTFTSIPQTYVDLFLVLTSQSAGSGTDGQTVRVNGDSGASSYTQNYFRYTQSVGTNGGYVSATGNPQSTTSAGQTNLASYAGTTTMYFPNYTSTSTAKGWNAKVGSDVNATTTNSTISIIGTQWTGTAAITSIQISGYALYPSAYTTLSLYGIS
jgi:hypothetical protein